jgi:hypothetical protein
MMTAVPGDYHHLNRPVIRAVIRDDHRWRRWHVYLPIYGHRRRRHIAAAIIGRPCMITAVHAAADNGPDHAADDGAKHGALRIMTDGLTDDSAPGCPCQGADSGIVRFGICCCAEQKKGSENDEFFHDDLL